jgi:hypothetical protein
VWLFDLVCGRVAVSYQHVDQPTVSTGVDDCWQGPAAVVTGCW